MKTEYWRELNWHAKRTWEAKNLHVIRRRIWRAPHGPSLRPLGPIGVLNFLQWLFNAHDCQDPKIGCSCYPSYRFPKLP